jgi:predicted AAA+ superfamily ATPase
VIEREIEREVERGGSVLLLGPRQTGKTTLVRKILRGRDNTMEYYLQDPSVRQSLESDPGRIIRQVEAESGAPLLFVDEAQKVPELFDAAQYLIDNKRARFILTRSSVRTLRRKGANLLPGRVKKHHLDPLLWSELGIGGEQVIREIALPRVNPPARYPFSDLLAFGALPAIPSIPETERAGYLRSYAETYLEEEIRAEALSRKIGAFSRFLELAAHESGTSPNLSKLSNESGVSVPAIKAYFQVLEDTLVVERVEPFLRNARKRILSSPRYYMFDTGVRNALARLPLSRDLADTQKGMLFEHLVVLELRRRIRALGKPFRTYYWRTSGGAEVDVILDLGDEVIPIEIKHSRTVARSEIRGVERFLDEYAPLARRGFVVIPEGAKERLTPQITLLPWTML